MRNLLEQIQNGLRSDLYYLSLFAALSLPDICGAMEATDGTASPDNYIHWFDEYVSPHYSGTFTGNDCYIFRCSLLHQGSSQHPKSNYSRVLFIEPNTTTNVFHNCAIKGALNIDIRIFCNDLIEGVIQWLEKVERTSLYTQNYDKFMRRYPNGLPPYIIGVPVIS